MSGTFGFYRNGRWVQLESFSNKEVEEYLSQSFNSDKKRFSVVGRPRFCGGVLAEFDNVDFIIYAKDSYIELTFAKINREKMSELIEQLTKWNKFSKTETTYYVEKAFENDSYTVIFENGYASSEEFRSYLKDDSLKITRFFVE